MKNNLIWMDLEMTGLSPEIERIIEIAAIATDSNLNILEESKVFVIKQPDTLLEAMDAWNSKHHGDSGLVEAVKNSSTTENQAMLAILDFVSKYVKRGATPLCGNSISHDRKFLKKYMPDLDDYFHYRNIDVSSINELAKIWNPDILANFSKKSTHRAIDDIKDSIAELSFYKNNFFKLP